MSGFRPKHALSCVCSALTLWLSSKKIKTTHTYIEVFPLYLK